ncbi:hypothetical protein chiPu_0018624 [Chiloscyllium punctatum]|uniref:Uncharacterized protein n=1 Tax=Chiloscyllium punctatum TaxID=137246 RepID=A0A401RP55_CHIPU|nr:hypothetical protein [Chiloscyllium punctatum]
MAFLPLLPHPTTEKGEARFRGDRTSREDGWQREFWWVKEHERKQFLEAVVEYRGWSRELIQGKWSPLVIYVLLGVSILLSVVILGTVFKLSRGTPEQTKSFIAEFRNEISQLKEIVFATEWTMH